MNNSPLVSIIMNCYNGEKYLRDAIDSVYKQTYDNWEIILFDNSSVDNTGKIAKSYNKKLKYYRNSKTVDLGVARNMALDKCSGEYVAILDCDDIWLSEKLAKQVKFMEANSNIDVCGSWVQLIGNYDGILELETESEKIKINLLTNRNLAHSAVMMRNSTLTKYDFNYNHTFTVAHDYDLWVRMFDHCSFANLPDPLLKYRMHNNQNSKKSEEQNDAETSRVLTNLLEKMGFQLNDSELVIHNKIFNGIGIDSVTIVKAFRYLIRLRSSNLREKIFEPIAFNEFLKLNWRRIMFKHNHKFMYWISVLLFFRPVNFNKVIYSRFSLLLIMINNK